MVDGGCCMCENCSTGMLNTSNVCYYNKKILYLCELICHAVNGPGKGPCVAMVSLILRETVFSGGFGAIYLYIEALKNLYATGVI